MSKNRVALQNQKQYKHNEAAVSQEICQLNYQLSKLPKVSRNVCSYTTKHAYNVIEEELENIQDKGYDFKFDKNHKAFFESLKKCYEITRVIKLRFKCKNNKCPEFVERDDQNSQRKWTSYYGLVFFRFYFEKSIKYSHSLMRFNIKIYGQKCYTCEQWGSGSIIKPNMLALAKLYSLIVENVLDQNDDPETILKLYRHEKYGMSPNRKRRDVQIEGGVMKHKSDLCQACYDGVCLGFYEPRNEESESEEIKQENNGNTHNKDTKKKNSRETNGQKRPKKEEKKPQNQRRINGRSGQERKWVSSNDERIN